MNDEVEITYIVYRLGANSRCDLAEFRSRDEAAEYRNNLIDRGNSPQDIKLRSSDTRVWGNMA